MLWTDVSEEHFASACYLLHPRVSLILRPWRLHDIQRTPWHCTPYNRALSLMYSQCNFHTAMQSGYNAPASGVSRRPSCSLCLHITQSRYLHSGATGNRVQNPNSRGSAGGQWGWSFSPCTVKAHKVYPMVTEGSWFGGKAARAWSSPPTN
jgi:hypothetical protein